ncbi:MAG: SUMF1/EgtB/PvdO family nonheme iron enzyme [Planctomycetia bacterium]
MPAQPVKLKEFVDGAPTGLDELIKGMIAKKPEERYADGKTAEAALDAFLAKHYRKSSKVKKAVPPPARPKTTTPFPPAEVQAAPLNGWPNRWVLLGAAAGVFAVMMTLLVVNSPRAKSDRNGSTTPSVAQTSESTETSAPNKGEPAPNPPVDSAPPEEITLSMGMKLKLLQPGSFIMGSPRSERGREDHESPVEVTLTKPFYMGVYEVTQGEWEEVMSQQNPSHFTNVAGVDAKRLPVELVSYDDALAFIAKLNRSENLKCRPVGNICCRRRRSGSTPAGRGVRHRSVSLERST